MTNVQSNLVLANLGKDDFKLVEQHLIPVTFPLRKCLEAAGRPIQSVYFPCTGIISVVAVSANRRHEAEVGLIGREGMTGLNLLLGAEVSSWDTVVQVEGNGQSIAADQLKKLTEKRPALRHSLLRYVQVFAVQASCTALANARGTLNQRLARWLLMARDRMPDDQLQLTHELLALMLGVRRAGVTTALHDLQRDGAISLSRGHILIVDRQSLERMADGLYGVPEREQQRVLALAANTR